MDWANTKALVTGAGGFIGSHLVERLLSLGADVTAFVRYNSRNDPGFLADINGAGQAARVTYGDITDAAAVRDAVRGADVVFHLAALVGIPYSYVHPHEVVEVNTMGTLNVLTAAKESEVKKVVVTSTSEVYGSASYVPMDEAHPKRPQSPYAASKIAADAIALSFYHSFNLPVAIVRPFNTYGPRQSDRAVIPTIICQALTNDEIRVGNVAPTRDFTFVTDTVEGFVKVAESENSIGQEINLGSGTEISVGALARKIALAVGRELPIRSADDRVRPGSSEVTRLLSGNAKAKRLTGWALRIDFETGLKLTIEWVKQHSAAYDPNAYRV